MATPYEIERALVDVLAEALIPNPTDPFQAVLSNSTVTTHDGRAVKLRIFVGEPNPDELRNEVSKPDVPPAAYITVNAVKNLNRGVKTFSRQWRDGEPVPVTVNTTVIANAVTFGGSPTAGQVVGVGYGNTGWSHRCSDGETVADIANAFVALIPNASATGATLHLDTLTPVVAPVGSDMVAYREVDRRAQVFSIDVLASDDAVREAVFDQIPALMADTPTLVMPFGPNTNPPRNLTFANDDRKQIVGVWKACQNVEVIYSAIRKQVQPTILWIGLNNEGRLSGHFHPAGPWVIATT